MLNRTAVKPVARATGKVVKGTAILAGAGAVYGTTKAMGKRDERKDRENERNNDRIHGSSTGEVNSSGDSSQFKMAQSKKSQNSTANVNNNKDASGNSAANNDVARQGRDISEAIQRDNIQQDKAENSQLIMVSLKDPRLSKEQLSKLISTEVPFTMQHLPNRLKDRLRAA